MLRRKAGREMPKRRGLVIGTLLLTLVFLFSCAASAQSTQAIKADDPFRSLKRWWYQGSPLPEPGSDDAIEIADAFRKRPKAPETMLWTRTAESYGVVHLHVDLLDALSR